MRPRDAARDHESSFPVTTRIEDDFHAWLLDQASLLRSHRYGSLDWSNLAEELEAMAAGERRELLRRLTTLLAHLLKLQLQPQAIARRGRGWKLTVTRSRREIRRLLDSSPGLKGRPEEFVTTAYSDSRRDAGVEAGLERYQWEEVFAQTCPWTLAQILDDDFLPATASSVTIKPA